VRALLAAHGSFADLDAGGLALLVAAGLAAAWTVWKGVVYTLHTEAEADPSHPKWSILEEDAAAPGARPPPPSRLG
jgi:hypothetical protein